MLIKSINLTNFRSHSSYHLDCNPDTTLILGPNGCGKTSVLEAITILLRGKSFRTDDPNILKRGAPFYRAELTTDDGHTVAATFDGHIKNFIVNNQKFTRLPLKFQYPLILFEPSDLNLITAYPADHRKYFDQLFSTISQDYTSTLNKYNKAREQRNQLLKSEFFDPSNLFPWDLLLARLGLQLCRYRYFFIDKINQSINDVYHSIAENTDKVSFIYKTTVAGLTETSYLKALEDSRTKDFALGYTSFGPHRDDFAFNFNQQNANGSASRGESRSFILALKFVEANLIEEITHKKPIVLLDDVFSELDESRRQCLVKNFKANQVILTSVEAIK